MCGRKDVLIDRDRQYVLTDDAAGQLNLEVCSGGIAVETFVRALSKRERDPFMVEGKSALDRLALRLAKQRSQYSSRITASK